MEVNQKKSDLFVKKKKKHKPPIEPLLNFWNFFSLDFSFTISRGIFLFLLSNFKFPPNYQVRALFFFFFFLFAKKLQAPKPILIY